MKSFLFGFFLCIYFLPSYSQKPEAQAGGVPKAPIVDGIPDPIWKLWKSYPIALPFQSETPTLGKQGETYWEALSDGDGVYILVHIRDSVFSPCYSDCNSWEFDRPELYFDCNFELVDGGGGQWPGREGHYMVSYKYNEALLRGGTQYGDSGIRYGHFVQDTTVDWEFFIPWSLLKDRGGKDFSQGHAMGFDVTIRDNDTPGTPGSSRAVWSNDGTGTALNESWNSMDDCGLLNFQNGPCDEGFELVAPDTNIAIDNGSMQIKLYYFPYYYNCRKCRVENGTGKASIDKNGLLTALMNGTIKVIIDGDPCHDSQEISINITNQLLSLDDINLLANGNFGEDGHGYPESWEGSIDTSNQQLLVREGVLECNPNLLEDGKNLQFVQTGNRNGWVLSNDTTYLLMFDAWSSRERTIMVSVEDDSVHGLEPYGDSPDSTSILGTSKWEIHLSPYRSSFIQHTTMKRIQPDSEYRLIFELAGDTGMVYLDNIRLFPLSYYTEYRLNYSMPQGTDTDLISLFPNPAQDYCIIHSNNEFFKSRCQLFDISGRQVGSFDLSGPFSRIPLVNLTNGIYFFNFTKQNGETVTLKLIRNH
ncbi:MAG: sugar-binding protein [Bacteroidales bacterium]